MWRSLLYSSPALSNRVIPSFMRPEMMAMDAYGFFPCSLMVRYDLWV